jgi:hypothetical protein
MQMLRLTGELHQVDRAITGTNYNNTTGDQNVAIGYNALRAEKQYTVTELHQFLQGLAKDASVVDEWDVSGGANVDDLFKNEGKTERKMGIVPPRAPIRRTSEAEIAKEMVKTASQRAADEKEQRDKAYWGEMERLINLRLHGEMHVASGVDAMRVPGGLIYYKTEGYGDGKSLTSTFVAIPELG